MPKIIEAHLYRKSRKQFEKAVKEVKCEAYPQLVEYLKQFSYKHSKENLFKTYLLLDDSDEILAYISFSLSSIENKEKLGASPSLNYPISALKITRLLVKDGLSGKGIGTELMRFADILAFSIAHLVACIFLIVDSKKSSKDFYLKNNFNEIGEDNDTILMFKEVGCNIKSTEIKEYLNFCKTYSLKTLEAYLYSIEEDLRFFQGFD